MRTSPIRAAVLVRITQSLDSIDGINKGRPSMNDSTPRPLWTELRKELDALGGDLGEMAAARWELAQLELQSDLCAAKRLAVAWLLAAVLALAALPLAAVALAKTLDGRCEMAFSGWLLIFAGGLLLLALMVGYFAWRWFRRRFVGFQETREELREDLLWLREGRASS
jgi:hypothetical protein